MLCCVSIIYIHNKVTVLIFYLHDFHWLTNSCTKHSNSHSQLITKLATRVAKCWYSQNLLQPVTEVLVVSQIHKTVMPTQDTMLDSGWLIYNSDPSPNSLIHVSPSIVWPLAELWEQIRSRSRTIGIVYCVGPSQHKANRNSCKTRQLELLATFSANSPV